MVKVLLENNAQVNIQDSLGKSSLTIASLNGHVDVIKVLLENAAQVDLQDNNGKSSLMVASKNSHVDVVNVDNDRYC